MKTRESTKATKTITKRRTQSEYYEDIVFYNKHIENNPDDYNAYYLRGNVWMILKEYAIAYMSYKEAIRLSPENMKVAEQLAVANARLEFRFMPLKRLLSEYNEDVAFYNKSIKENPEDYSSCYHRGNALMSVKEYRKAINSYKECMELSPENMKVAEQLAIAKVRRDYEE